MQGLKLLPSNLGDTSCRSFVIEHIDTDAEDCISSEKRNAGLFHDHYVVKHFFAVWKRSLSKVQVSMNRSPECIVSLTHISKALEQKAIKYQNRQNGFLLRALLHVWATRERGALMDRTKKARNIQSAWLMWKARLKEQKNIERK